MNFLTLIWSSSFEEQDSSRGIFSQTAGQNAASRTSSNDDIVVHERALLLWKEKNATEMVFACDPVYYTLDIYLFDGFFARDQ
jgi:hypothetical protein